MLMLMPTVCAAFIQRCSAAPSTLLLLKTKNMQLTLLCITTNVLPKTGLWFSKICFQLWLCFHQYLPSCTTQLSKKLNFYYHPDTRPCLKNYQSFSPSKLPHQGSNPHHMKKTLFFGMQQQKKRKTSTIVSTSTHPFLWFLSSIKNMKKKTNKNITPFLKKRQRTLKIIQKLRADKKSKVLLAHSLI